MIEKRKKILFVNESLGLAGGEKSLATLLSNIDESLFEVDLQLFAYGGALEQFLPSHINLLPPLPYTQFARKSWKDNMFQILSKGGISYLLAKVRFSLALRGGNYNNPEKAQMYWECVKNAFPLSKKKYDVVIAYAQGVPTFYVADKILASKKITWVNANVVFRGENKKFQEQYYARYDYIVPVSSITKEHFVSLFPSLDNKCHTIYDLIDHKAILNLADAKEFHFASSTFNILTVSRLNNTMKGMDITMEVCKILKQKGVDFHWYVLGEGSYKADMERFVKSNELEDHFTLLGTTPNPYPYFKAADLYVQTSRNEGFGLSIAEARLLNVPVVTTRFDTVDLQMIHEKNGLVAEIDPVSVSEAIIRIKDDTLLYQSIVKYLTEEPKGNLKSIEQFNKLVLS